MQRQVRTITVASGKGGVGKTNIVANTAIALSRMGKKVLIFDADLGLSNIDVILGLAPKFNIHHVLTGEKSLKDVIVEGPEGVLVMPAASGIQEMTHIDEFQRMTLLEEFDSLDMDIDYLIVDSAAGISANVAFFCVASQQTIVVTNPEPTALTDAYALIKVLITRYQERSFGVLVNSARDDQDAREVFKKLAVAADRFLSASLDYLGFIPYDETVRRAVREQKAVLVKYPGCKASIGIRDLAERINKDRTERVKGSLQFFFGSLLGIGRGGEVTGQSRAGQV